MNAMIVPLGALVVFSCLLSTILILLHHFNLNRVPIQNKIINIIWLVPITGVSSYAVICGIKYNIYLEFIRDTYQAYCCYLFFALLLAYLGCHDDEDLFAIETYLETSSVSQLPFPLTILFSEPNLKGRKFLRFIQSGVLQFCVVKSFLVCISLLMQLFGYFHEYNFDPRYGYIWVTIFLSVSIMYSVLCFTLFFHSLKLRLKPFHITGKFISIMFILFAVYFQGIIIQICINYGFIKNKNNDNDLTKIIQATLTIIEMFIFSILNFFVFSHRPFIINDRNKSIQQPYEFLSTDDAFDDGDFGLNNVSKNTMNNKSIKPFVSNSKQYSRDNNNNNKHVHFSAELVQQRYINDDDNNTALIEESDEGINV
jgi:hypothetical protein